MLRWILPKSWFVTWYHPRLFMRRTRLKFMGPPNGSYYWIKEASDDQ